MISQQARAKFLRSVLEDFGVIGHVLEEVVENLLNILDSNKDGSISLSEVEESASMIEKILNIDDTGAKYTRFFKWLGYDLSNKGETIREHTRLKFSTVKEHDEHIYNSAVKFATREILFGVVFAACSMLILFSLPLADPYSSPKENWLFIFVLLPCELAYVAWWLDANFTMMAPTIARPLLRKWAIFAIYIVCVFFTNLFMAYIHEFPNPYLMVNPSYLRTIQMEPYDVYTNRAACLLS